MCFVADKSRGIAIAAWAEPLSITLDGVTVFALRGSIPSDESDIAWLTDHPSDDDMGGPRLTMAMFAPVAADGSLPAVGGGPSLMAEGSAHITLLGAELRVDLQGVDGDWDFASTVDLFVFKAELTARFRADDGNSGVPRLQGSLSGSAGLDLGSVDTLLGKLDFGKLMGGFTLNQVLDLGAHGLKYDVSGTVVIPVVRTELDFKFSLDISVETFEDIGRWMRDEFIESIADLARHAFITPAEWALAVAQGVWEVTEDAVGILRDAFGAPFNEMEGALTTAFGFVAEEALHAIISAGRTIAGVVADFTKWIWSIFGKKPSKKEVRAYAEDCFANPNRYWVLVDWREMLGTDQASWGVLGWNLSNWEGDAPVPSSMSRRWAELNEDERNAARRLAFTEREWDFGFDHPAEAFRAQRATEPIKYWQNFDWGKIGEHDRERWETLGWDSEMWAEDDDDAHAPLSYFKDWGSLTPDERQAARLLGLTEAKWDPNNSCNPDGYWNRFAWSELSSEHQRLWRLLGWDQPLWDNEAEGEVSTSGKWYWQLTETEQQAATALGYSSRTWRP
jgi:hypothetical protein